jgi:GTP pyrophosphokinase
MAAQKVRFEEVFDKFAIRIVYDSDLRDEKFLAWKIYSIVTDFYKPSPNRLRDWISSPKSSGYEALHVTVMGPKGRWVEVQIRSERMDEIAEKGFAAHHKYKLNSTEESNMESWLNLLKEALESTNSLDAIEFVEDFKLNLYSKEIYVFTPKGEIKSLPKGATALDFAFSVHTEIGIRTLGTRVNGKLVSLNHILNSGDQIEIITSPNQKPNSQWLDFVTTSKAKTKIKNVLNENVKKIAEDGKEVLVRKLRHLKITVNERVINDLVNFFRLKTSLDLFYRVGIGSIENQQLKDFVAQRNSSILSFFKRGIQRKSTTPDQINKQELTKNYDMLVFGLEQEKLDYKFANCCNPIPGDDVFGFLTINEGIKIHRADCPNAISLQSNFAYRILLAKWIDSSQEEFLATLEITGMDSLGLTNRLTKVISNQMHVDIQNLNLNSGAGLFNGKISVVVQNKTILKKLIEKIKTIDGIEKVTRINN